jgi:hypothetical protein
VLDNPCSPIDFTPQPPAAAMPGAPLADSAHTNCSWDALKALMDMTAQAKLESVAKAAAVAGQF